MHRAARHASSRSNAARIIVTVASAGAPELRSTTRSGSPSRAVTYHACGASSTICCATVKTCPRVHSGSIANGSAR